MPLNQRVPPFDHAAFDLQRLTVLRPQHTVGGVSKASTNQFMPIEVAKAFYLNHLDSLSNEFVTAAEIAVVAEPTFAAAFIASGIRGKYASTVA